MKNTGDFFDRKHARLAYDIYATISSSGSVLAPTAGFVFDRETLSDHDVAELARLTSVPVRILPRRMFESYLLSVDAIHTLLSSRGIGRDSIVTWLAENVHRFIGPRADADWLATLDAAALLASLFDELSGARFPYRKVEHGRALCRWLLETEPDRFQELRSLLMGILALDKRRLNELDSEMLVDHA